MGWKQAEFKGQTVWAKVDETGAPVVADGRVEIRYKDFPGAKIYRGAASRIELKADASVEDLPDGVSADAKPSPKAGDKKSSGSGFGKAGTRTAQQAALAKDAAVQLIDGLTGKAILCFTDGACKGNPGPAGSGAVVTFPDGKTEERHLALGTATNNVAELTAIRLALEVLDTADVPPSTEVAIFTDSNYANGVLTKGWKAKANVELIADLRTRLATRTGVSVYWIAGHVGVDGNERADELANMGVMSS